MPRTWKWRSGLSVYVGDAIFQQLTASGLLSADEAMLLRTNTPAALGDPKVAKALQILAQHSGHPPPDLNAVLEAHANGGDFGWARGRPVSAFDHVCGETATRSLGSLGEGAGIRFRFDVDFGWHPVESQRALAWAGRFGRQEEYVDVLARMHFEEADSVNHRATLTAAAAEVGLDAAALGAFLDTAEGEREVWESYRDTTGKHGIHSIPYFVFNGETTSGGPFRGGSGGHTVNGSASVGEFRAIFDRILREGWRADAPGAGGGAARRRPAGSSGGGGGLRKGFLL